MIEIRNAYPTPPGAGLWELSGGGMFISRTQPKNSENILFRRPPGLNPAVRDENLPEQ